MLSEVNLWTDLAKIPPVVVRAGRATRGVGARVLLDEGGTQLAEIILDSHDGSFG